MPPRKPTTRRLLRAPKMKETEVSEGSSLDVVRKLDFATKVEPVVRTSTKMAFSQPPAFKNIEAGGFDKLTLDSLYEDAMVRQTAYSGQGGYGSNQHGNNPFESNSMLSSGLYDPFAMSNNVPPPPNVQMAAMAQQQQAMVLHQQPQQMMPLSPTMMAMPQSENPFGDPFETNYTQGVGSFTQSSHQNNPFGNPGFL